MTDNILTWTYEDISVLYQPHLDGDGRSMADQFVKMIETEHAERLPFDTCYEWCSGPGFIGFALLAKKICKQLILADINPDAVAIAKQTVKKNQLEEQVRVYESDNLNAIPSSEKFDLVVSNPPNYFCLNPLHPSYSILAKDLRPNDPDWAIHKAFYSSISGYLNPDAVLCIEEVDPYATKCFMPNLGANQPIWGPEPFDIRPRPPIEDFQLMIANAGLTFDKVLVLPEKDVPVHVLVSHFNNSNVNNIKLKPNVTFFEQVGELENGSYRLMAMENNQVIGHIDLPDDRLWLVGMIELLIDGASEGLTQEQISKTLDLPIDHIASATIMLKNQMRWVI